MLKVRFIVLAGLMIFGLVLAQSSILTRGNKLHASPNNQAFDDHGNSIESATPVDSDSFSEANLESGGDADYFSFPAFSGQVYIIETELGDLSDSVLTLYDDFGLEVAYNDDVRPEERSSFIQYSAESSGKLHVGVTAYSSSDTGSYTLIISDAQISDDHGDTIESATSTQADFGSPGSLETSGDADFFTFRSIAGEIYVIETFLGDLDDSILTLYDSNGAELGYNDDVSSGDRSSRIEFSASTSGSVFIAVEGYSSGDTGNYTLSILNTTDGGGNDDHGGTIGTATQVGGNSASHGAIESSGDQDYFTLPAVVGQTFTFKTTLDSLGDSVLTLFDGSGTELGYNDDVSSSDRSSLIEFTSTSTGDLYLAIEAYSFSETGTYVLNVTSSGSDNGGGGGEDDHGDTIPTATLISLGDLVVASIDSESDLDVFSFQTVAITPYWIEARFDSSADTFLRILDAEGLEAVSDFSLLGWVAPTTDVYYLSVEPSNFTDVGTYSMSLSPQDPVAYYELGLLNDEHGLFPAAVVNYALFLEFPLIDGGLAAHAENRLALLSELPENESSDGRWHYDGEYDDDYFTDDDWTYRIHNNATLDLIKDVEIRTQYVLDCNDPDFADSFSDFVKPNHWKWECDNDRDGNVVIRFVTTHPDIRTRIDECETVEFGFESDGRNYAEDGEGGGEIRVSWEIERDSDWEPVDVPGN